LSVKADDELSILSLKYQERDVIQFHTTDIMNQFIKFILQRAIGAKISDILMNLKVPCISDLEKSLLTSLRLKMQRKMF